MRVDLSREIARMGLSTLDAIARSSAMSSKWHGHMLRRAMRPRAVSSEAVSFGRRGHMQRATGDGHKLVRATRGAASDARLQEEEKNDRMTCRSH